MTPGNKYTQSTAGPKALSRASLCYMISWFVEPQLSRGIYKNPSVPSGMKFEYLGVLSFCEKASSKNCALGHTYNTQHHTHQKNSQIAVMWIGGQSI